jgi:hypothetical protein
MLTCFRSCPQKFYNEFLCGYRPPGLSIDLHAGACFAFALETVYKQVHLHHKTLDDALVTAHAGFAQMWGQFEIPEWKRTAKTFDRVWEAVEGYFSMWSPLTDHVQPYFTSEGKPTFEYTFAIPLEPTINRSVCPADFTGFPTHPDGGPFLYCGRFDMLGTYEGRPIIRDEKTTGASIGDRWSEQWDLRNQFMGYVWACQQCGIDLDTVCIRGVGIQKTKLDYKEAIKPYSRELLGRWHEQVRRDLWRIRASWDAKYFDYDFGNTCTAYGSCVFMRVCGSANPESWLNEFEVRRWDPLHKDPTQNPPTTEQTNAKQVA